MGSDKRKIRPRPRGLRGAVIKGTSAARKKYRSQNGIGSGRVRNRGKELGRSKDFLKRTPSNGGTGREKGRKGSLQTPWENVERRQRLGWSPKITSKNRRGGPPSRHKGYLETNTKDYNGGSSRRICDARESNKRKRSQMGSGGD